MMRTTFSAWNGRPIVVAVAAILTVTTLRAAPPSVDTVKIGKETKKTIGVVMEAVSGDVSCYVKLKDDRGVVFDEMAGFEICEQPKLVGKRVMLTYSLEKVLADECGGDPECKKTKTVALVTSVRVLAKRTKARGSQRVLSLGETFDFPQ
jgi:hypothetical protein